MWVPLYIICHFPLVAFNLLLLSLIFCQFDYCVSHCVPPWIYPSWDSLCFLNLVDYFLSHIREFFSYYRFKYFLWSILSLFSFWNPFNMNIGAFNAVPEVSLGCLYFFSLFFLYYITWQWFLPFCLPGHLSILLPLLRNWFLLVYYSSLFVCSLVLSGIC